MSLLKQKKRRATISQTISTNHEPSTALLKEIKELILMNGNMTDKVRKIFEIGIADGLNKIEILELLKNKYAEMGRSYKTLRPFIPSMYLNVQQVQEGRINMGEQPLNEQEISKSATEREAAKKKELRIEAKKLKAEEYDSSRLWVYPKNYLIEIIKWYEAKERKWLEMLQSRQLLVNK